MFRVHLENKSLEFGLVPLPISRTASENLRHVVEIDDGRDAASIEEELANVTVEEVRARPIPLRVAPNPANLELDHRVGSTFLEAVAGI